MKTTRSRRLGLAATCVLLASLDARAADENLRPIAFQNGVNQQSLSTETAELAKQITALIEELQRNGFPIQSLSGLTELAAQLNSLGGKEMAGIAARLRKLGESASTDPRATATEAYLAQQTIESRLKNLARQISIQQLREETARRLEALITRQLAIQRETRGIASKPDADRQRILESDQTAIGEDLATFFQTGENLLARLREGETPAPGAATPAPASPATPPPAAQAPAKPGASAAPAKTGATAAPAAPATPPTFTERINGAYLTTLSTEATDFIKGKRYPDAYARQESLIAELRKILQSILSSLPKEQRLASALQQVSALRQQEEANQQAKTPPTPEAKQAAADQAQSLANQTAQISPEASAALRDAQKKLQEDAKADQNGAQQQQQANADAQKQDQKGQQQQPNAQQPNAAQTAQNDQKQDGQKQDGQQTAQTPQAAQDQAAQQNGQQDQQAGQSEAAKALAAAENALRKELAQAQQQNGQGQQQQPGQTPEGQQTAQNQQQQNGQQQAQNGQGQPKPGEGQQQQQQTGQGQAQQTAQNGQPDPNAQPKNGTGEGPGDEQNQIAGSGNTNADPAQVLGALKREEREAFSALQNERYPAEYSAWVQQYWRNLAQEQ